MKAPWMWMKELRDSYWQSAANRSARTTIRRGRRADVVESLESRALLSRTVSVAAGIASLSGTGDGINENLRLYVESGNVVLDDFNNNALVAGAGTTQVAPNKVQFVTRPTGYQFVLGTGQDVLSVAYDAGNPLGTATLQLDLGSTVEDDTFGVFGAATDEYLKVFADPSQFVANLQSGSVAQLEIAGAETVSFDLGLGNNVFEVPTLPDNGVDDLFLDASGGNDTYVVSPSVAIPISMSAGAGSNRLVTDLEGVENAIISLSQNGGTLISNNRAVALAGNITEFIVTKGEYDLVADFSSFMSANDGSGDLTSVVVSPELTAYEFFEVASADFSGPGQFTQLNDTPAINDAGQVGFFAVQDANGGTPGVFRSDGESLQTIATPGQAVNATLSIASGFNPFNGATSINDDGVVGFGASTLLNGMPNIQGNPYATILGGSGGALTVFGLSATDANVGPNFFSGTVMDSGNALMHGGISQGQDLYLGNGVAASIFYDSSNITSPGSIGAFFGVDVAGNDNTFVASAGPNPGAFHYIVKGNGGPLTTIIDVTNPASLVGSLSTNPAINAAGTVAFIAQESGGGPLGIYVGDGGPLTKLVDTTGPYQNFNSSYGVGIDGAGNIAFLATLDVGNTTGIFTGPDPLTDKVIMVGDPLFGSVVTGLSFAQQGLSNNGQIAFWASLQDGRQVIVRAEPVSDEVDVELNGVPIFAASLQHISSVTLIGSDDDDLIQFSFPEEVLSLVEEIAILGGEQTTADEVELLLGDFFDITHNFAGPDSGEILLEDVFRISYSNLETVDDAFTCVERTFGFGPTDDIVSIGDDSTPGDEFFEISSADSSVRVTFLSPSPSKLNPGLPAATSVHLNDGADIIEILSPDSASQCSLLIDGDSGNDLFGIHGTLNASTTLRGSEGDDVFGFAPVGTIAGSMLGGPGRDGLNYLAIGTGVAVSLNLGTATGVTGTFGEIENVTGGSGPDSIIGDLNDNVLFGADGNDTIRGGGGRDSVVGESGNDSLFGQGGVDTLDGGPGIDFLDGGTSGTALADEIDGTVVLSNTGYTTPGGDRALAESLFLVTLTGGNGNDNISVNALTSGLATVFGGGGNDTILGGLGNDVLAGGDGDDNVSGAGGQDSVFGGDGNDTVRGQGGSDVISGGLGDDRIDGGTGDNVLREDVDANLTLSTSGGLPVLSGAGIDVFVGAFVAAQLTGGLSDNSLIASAFSGSVTLTGGGGNDNLIGSAFASLLIGGAGNDTLSAGGAVDRLFGDEGDDVLSGGAANDLLRGGLGNDTINGGDGIDVVTEQAQSNFVVTGQSVSSPVTGNDSNSAIERLELAGGSGANLLDARGSSIPVVLNGSNGNDTLLGSPFADTLIGGSGDDVLSGGAGQDSIDGGTGRDTSYELVNVNVVITNRRLTSSATGNETMSGIEGFALVGGAGATKFDASLSAVAVTLLGGGGNDTLLGSNFIDVLIGGSRTVTPLTGDGTDVLDGGAANDSYDNDPLDTRVVNAGDQVVADLFATLPSWLDAL